MDGIVASENDGMPRRMEGMSENSFLEETIYQNVSSGQRGFHLIIDGFGGPNNLLADPKHVEYVLLELVRKLNIQDAVPKGVCNTNPQNPLGVSGMIIGTESHVVIHTFPNRGSINADIFSSNKHGNAIEIVSEFQELFQLDSISSKLVERKITGLEKSL